MKYAGFLLGFIPIWYVPDDNDMPMQPRGIVGDLLFWPMSVILDLTSVFFDGEMDVPILLWENKK